MPGICMECYTGRKWVKMEYSLPQILNLSLPKCLQLTGHNIQAKISSHSRECVLGESQLYALILMAKG